MNIRKLFRDIIGVTALVDASEKKVEKLRLRCNEIETECNRDRISARNETKCFELTGHDYVFVRDGIPFSNEVIFKCKLCKKEISWFYDEIPDKYIASLRSLGISLEPT